MGPTVAELVAGIIDRIEARPFGSGRPPMPTVEIIETLRFFLREGVQWRELRAADGRASGSPLRRRLEEWHTTALLRRVHAVLVRMARSGPDAAAWDVVVDSCSVRAKHGGELAGPNPTDRRKPGSKYHVVVSTDGLPLAVMPSAASVHDTMLFPDLLRLAQVVCAAIGRLYADRLRQCRQSLALPARRGSTAHPQDRRAPRLRARKDPMRCRARLRLAAREQTTGSMAG